MFLQHFIDFSIKLNLILKYINKDIQDKTLNIYIPNEIKLLIWHQFYKVLVSKEIIVNVLGRGFQCDECKHIDWKTRFRDINACSDGRFGPICCYKTVCKNSCNIMLKCGHTIILPYYEFEIDIITLDCEICHTKEIRNNIWWGLSIIEYERRYDP